MEMPESEDAMLENTKVFVLDMDGTIYLGRELFPFTKDFLSKVTETGRPIMVPLTQLIEAL